MMTLIYRTVTGTYLNPDSTPKRGYIEFTPSHELVERPGARIPPIPTRVDLDATGSFSLPLLTTDNATIEPTGWKWVVDEKIEGCSPWYLDVPVNASPLDISYNFLPNSASAPIVAVAGPIGPIGPIGPTGPMGEVTTVAMNAAIAADNAAQDIEIANAIAAHSSTQSAEITAAVALRVAKAGDTMGGPLVLPGNPTLNLQAAPKQYVDQMFCGGMLVIGGASGSVAANGVIPFDSWGQGGVEGWGGLIYSNPYGMRVPYTARYLILAQVLVVQGSQGDIRVGINGVQSQHLGGYNMPTTGENYSQTHQMGILALNANDVIDVRAINAFSFWGAGSAGGLAHSAFTITRVG